MKEKEKKKRRVKDGRGVKVALGSTVRQAERQSEWGRNACGVPFPIFSPLSFWWRGGLTGQDRGTACLPSIVSCFFSTRKLFIMHLVNDWTAPF